MKKIVLFILGALPFVAAAQTGCGFFENRKIEIEKTSINTAQSDFGPAFVDGQFWFSAFTDEEIEKLEQGSDKHVFYNLFSMGLNNNANIEGSKKSLFEDISEGYHAGPVSYCGKTGELFVTLSNFENPEVRNKVYRKADIGLKIIITKKIDGIWRLVEEFPYNDPTYSVGHPAISITGDTLFFASNKPNSGFGATDIYMSIRNGGNWGQPINLGEKINSPYDEMFPFLFESSTLFYASNQGKGEQGDFDIYFTCEEGDDVAEPISLDALNTDEDDFGLIIHDNEEVGYFVSRRSGGQGDDDIYKVRFEGEYHLELVVMDKETKQAIQNPAVNFSDNVSGVLSGVVITRALLPNKSIVATSEINDYQNSSATINTAGKPFGVIRDTIWVEKVEVGQKFVMENIFYDFDKWDILPESKIELDKLVKIMDENPNWKVELGSHTDSRGIDSYNEILSQKRSDSAVGYIVGSGIGKDRIIAKGYGETQLVNQCGNGVNCTEKEHRENRRTEFTILEMDGK